jgi:hypothetical protein
MSQMQKMFNGMTATLDKKMDLMAGSVKSDIDAMGKRMDGVASGLGIRIGEVALEVEEMKKKMSADGLLVERRLRELENRRVEPGAMTKSSREELAYWEARASLRLCPVGGPDLLDSLKAFLVDTLEIDESIMTRLSLSSIKKLPEGRNKKFAKEAVIKFESVSDRDMIKGAAFRLAGKHDHSIRLELPNHLLSQHRLLSSAAQKLRQSSQGSRTNVRFDDDNLGLVLDYRTKQDLNWKRLYPEEARQVGQMQDQSVATSRATAEECSQLLTAPTGANALPIGQ